MQPVVPVDSPAASIAMDSNEELAKEPPDVRQQSKFLFFLILFKELREGEGVHSWGSQTQRGRDLEQRIHREEWENIPCFSSGLSKRSKCPFKDHVPFVIADWPDSISVAISFKKKTKTHSTEHCLNLCCLGLDGRVPNLLHALFFTQLFRGWSSASADHSLFFIALNQPSPDPSCQRFNFTESFVIDPSKHLGMQTAWSGLLHSLIFVEFQPGNFLKGKNVRQKMCQKRSLCKVYCLFCLFCLYGHNK